MAMMETEDVRLSQERLAAIKELITPIRDLAKNWDIDINSELKKYMLSFEAETLEYDNFAEAAFVLQGTANIWGHKVEYLYKMAVQSLNLIEEQDNSTDSDDLEGSNTVGRTKQKANDPMVLGPVSLKTSQKLEVPLNSSSFSINFKPRLPLFLLSHLRKSCQVELPLTNMRGEVVGNRGDFLVNTCLSHKSGFAAIDIDSLYLLNKTFKKELTPFYKRSVTQFTAVDNSGGLPPPIINDDDDVVMGDAVAMETDEPSHRSADLAAAQPGDEVEEKISDDKVLELHDDTSGDEVLGSLSEEPKSPHTPISSSLSKSETHLPTRTPVIILVRQRLDPYTRTQCKAFVKAHVKPPPELRKRKRKKPPNVSLNDVLKSYCSRKKYQSTSQFTSVLRQPIYPENVNLCKKLEAKEKTLNNNVKRRIANQGDDAQELPSDLLKPIIIPEPEDDDDEVVIPERNAEDEDDGGDLGGVTMPTATLPPDPDIIPSALEIMEHVQESQLDPVVVVPGGPITTYEDMVKEHVAKFTADAQNHFKLSQLRGRVMEWERRIVPLLEKEETTRPYDVTHYSTAFLERLSSRPNMESNFKDICDGLDKNEVCRYFLTSLMLTNSSNITVVKGGCDPAFKLQSSKLFSETLEGYIAPSDCRPNLSKKRKPE